MTINTKKIVPGIQYLRGLAALAVVLCHYGSNLKEYPSLRELLNYGQMGVHIFFFISGYVIVLSLLKNNYHPKFFLRFLLKRTVRIDPMYLITIILTLLTFGLLKQIPSFKGNSITFVPEQFLAHVFYFVPFTKWHFYNHIFWTLCVEFQFYLLIGLIYFLSVKMPFRITFLLIFPLTSFIPFHNSYYLLSNYAPIFSLGMASMHYRESPNKWYLISMLTSAIIVFLRFDISVVIVLFCSIVLIFYLQITSKFLALLGNISYSLYLTHPLILIYLAGITKRMIANNQHYELPILATQIAIALCIAYISYVIIEKPAIAFSKQIAYRKP